MTNFDRHRAHKHKWFEESLCELASLFVLHRLADGWKERPPPCFETEAFEPNFKTYAEEIEQGHRQPGDGDFRTWLTVNLDRLEKDPFIRELNGTFAIALLGRSLEDPSLWRDCAQLNCWDANDNETFESYLDAWAKHLKARGASPRVPNLVKGWWGSPPEQVRVLDRTGNRGWLPSGRSTGRPATPGRLLPAPDQLAAPRIHSTFGPPRRTPAHGYGCLRWAARLGFNEFSTD